MKRIVISCDGTWNRADARSPTNALKLARAVEPEDAHGTEQIVCHLDGVGTGRGTGLLARLIDTALGGAMGLGLMQNVTEAYRFLVFNHAPGDEIFLFGFSRGAYTARTLVGLIRNCGLIGRNHIDRLPEAMALYRARGDATHPNREIARAFRARYAIGGADSFPDIAYLGVWDTVGALGIPRHLWWAARLNRGLAFHDTALSGKVRAARHAVAIDERRLTYEPALWDNLEALNAGRPNAPYQQVWFPGDHSSVGGGQGTTLLANDALHWVALGAMEAGLALDGAAMASWSSQRDYRAPIPIRNGILDRLTAMGLGDRPGPGRLDDLARAALLRWQLDPRWRPGALGHVARVLDQPPPDLPPPDPAPSDLPPPGRPE